MSEKTYKIITDFEMEEITPNEWRLTKYIGFDFESGYIEIPSEIEGKKIVELGVNLFSSSKGIQCVKIGEGIKKIGNYAFAHTSIQRIYFPQSLIEIGDGAFLESSIEKLIFPNSVSKIGKRICLGTYSLKKTILPNGVKEIPEEAFASCSNLKEITIPDNIRTIATKAFYSSGISSLQFPDRLSLIGESAFEQTNLASVVIPQRVQTIQKNAFKGSPITSLEISEGVENIGEYAFEETLIKSIVIPPSVRKIDKGAFKFCQELKEIIFKQNCQATVGDEVFNKKVSWNPKPVQRDDEDYSDFISRYNLAKRCYEEEILKLGRVKCFIPTSMSKIGSCFSIEVDNWGVTSVVEKFYNNTYIYCEKGSYAMDWARRYGLKCFDYHSNLPEYLKPSKVSDDSQETAIISETDNYAAIIKTESIISVVEEIETSTVTESSVVNSEATEIKDVSTSTESDIDDIVKEETVQINQADSEPTPVDPFAIFEYEETAEGIVIKKCNDITLKKVVVPDGVIKIGMKAFYAMEYLEEVVLPENLQYIGAEAFRDCKKLSTLMLPKSLIKIGRAAFLGCLGFPHGDYFVIPKNVVEIEPFALPYRFLAFENKDNWVRVDWLSRKEKFMGKVPSDKLKFADKARDYYHKNNNDTWIRK